MVVVEKMEVELGVLERDAIDTLKRAEEQLEDTKKAQVEFSETTSKSLGMFSTAIIGAFSGLLFWVAKTSPVLEFHMSNIGFAFENIAYTMGDLLAPAFEWAENAAWGLSDAFDDVITTWDNVSTGAEELGDDIRDMTGTAVSKLSDLGTSIANITKDLLNIPESTDTTINVKYLKTFGETLTEELEGIEEMTAPEKAKALITAPVTAGTVSLVDIGKDIGEAIFRGITGTTAPSSKSTWEEHQAQRERQIQSGVIKPRQDYAELYSKNFISSGIYNKLKEAELVN